jgi:hypothetical protein
MLGKLGIFFANAAGRKPVEDSELAFAEPLVDYQRRLVPDETAGLADRPGRLPRTHVGRAQDDLRLLLVGKRCEPMPQCSGLPPAKVAQRNIDVAHVDIDGPEACCVCSVACDIAGALTMPDDPQSFGPALPHGSSNRDAP